MIFSTEKNRTQEESGKEMKKKNGKRSGLFRSLVVSVLMTFLSMLCLAGATYAWFTGVAMSEGSSIKEGIMDVELYKFNKSSSDEDDAGLDISEFAEKCEDITDEVQIFTGTLEPGGEMIQYVALVNEGDAFSEYGLAFTVENINFDPDEESETGDDTPDPDEDTLEGVLSGGENLADVIDVYFAFVDKDTGETGQYIYMGKLGDIADSEEYENDTAVCEALDRNLNDNDVSGFVRGLLLTKSEAEGNGFKGIHTKQYDPPIEDGLYVYSIERLRKSLIGYNISEDEEGTGEEPEESPETEPEEPEEPEEPTEEITGDYKQVISIKLALPDKVAAKYQNCNIKVGLKVVATQSAKRICTITAYTEPDEEGTIMGYVLGGGTYHKNISGEDDEITLTPIAKKGYKFLKWRYALTGWEEDMEESTQEEQIVSLNMDYTYIAEFVKDSEYHDSDIDPDWDDEDEDDEYEEKEEDDPFG